MILYAFNPFQNVKELFFFRIEETTVTALILFDILVLKDTGTSLFVSFQKTQTLFGNLVVDAVNFGSARSFKMLQLDTQDIHAHTTALLVGLGPRLGF